MMKEADSKATDVAYATSFHQSVFRTKNFIIVVLAVWNLTLLLQLPHTTQTTNTTLEIVLQTAPRSPWNAETDTDSNRITSSSTIEVRDHPHAGARDENGEWHYVPDVTALRRSVLQQIDNDSITSMEYLPIEVNDTTICQLPPGEGFEGPNGYKVLHEYVEVNGPDPIPEAELEQMPDPPWFGPEILNARKGHLSRMKHAATTYSERGDHNATAIAPPRILCAVYTYQGHHDRVADIADTWGWRCDGFMAASTATNRDIGAVDLPHEGEEKYDNMWQKTRSMVAFMYDHYLDEFDYFLLCGDDTYVIVENLRNYLIALESTTGGRESGHPLYIGAPIHLYGVNYNTGGSAYILNRSALRRLVELALPHYFAHTICSVEDVFMGIIMTALSIPIVDTSDVHHRQRFFHNDLNSVGSDDGMSMYADYMYQHHYDYNPRVRTGRNLVSTQSIGFHHVESMKRFHAILYQTCPNGTVLGDAL